jgi:hypothetical protein
VIAHVDHLDPRIGEFLDKTDGLDKAGRVLGESGVICGEPAREELSRAKAELARDSRLRSACPSGGRPGLWAGTEQPQR